MINSSIKLFLKYQWFPPLNNSLTKFQCHLINMIPLKIQFQGNQSINLLIFVYKKSAVCRLGAFKSKHKAIIAGNPLWSSIKNRHGHTKTNQKLKEDLYNCILQHTQFVQSPIANGCICVYIDVKSKKTLVPKFLFQVSVRELHNSMVISPEEGGLKEAIYVYNSIVISYPKLRNILPPKI